MLRLILLFTLLVISVIFAKCQFNECDKIRTKEITNISINDTSAISNAYQIIKKCLQLDSIDLLIFNNTSFVALAIEKINEKESTTYGDIMNQIQSIRQSDYYERTRKSAGFHSKYFDKIVSKKDSVIIWESFNYLNESIDTDSLIAFIYSTGNLNSTYKDAYLKYINKQNGIIEKQHQEEEKKFNEISQEFDYYANALNKAKTENKSIILCFNAYGNIHGRQFESTILRNSTIIETIKNYYLFYQLFVDDKSKINDIDAKNILPLTFPNKGKYYQYLEKELINSDRQTILVIISNNGNIVYEKLVSQLTEEELLSVLNKNKQ